MKSLNELSKNVSLMILKATGVLFPVSGLASIVVSCTLSVIQRVSFGIYNMIKQYFTSLDEERQRYSLFLNNCYTLGNYDIFIDFSENSSFN